MRFRVIRCSHKTVRWYSPKPPESGMRMYCHRRLIDLKVLARGRAADLECFN